MRNGLETIATITGADRAQPDACDRSAKHRIRPGRPLWRGLPGAGSPE